MLLSAATFQTRVIGHTRQTGCGERIPRLGQRVVLKARTGFGRFVKRRHIVQRHQRQPRQPGAVQYAAQFGQLLGVAAGDQKRDHQLFPNTRLSPLYIGCTYDSKDQPDPRPNSDGEVDASECGDAEGSTSFLIIL
jgi:hypothetical protein